MRPGLRTFCGLEGSTDRRRRVAPSRGGWNGVTLRVTTLAMGCVAWALGWPQWRNNLQAQGYPDCTGIRNDSLKQICEHLGKCATEADPTERAKCTAAEACADSQGPSLE